MQKENNKAMDAIQGYESSDSNEETSDKQSLDPRLIKKKTIEKYEKSNLENADFFSLSSGEFNSEQKQSVDVEQTNNQQLKVSTSLEYEDVGNVNNDLVSYNEFSIPSGARHFVPNDHYTDDHGLKHKHLKSKSNKKPYQKKIQKHTAIITGDLQPYVSNRKRNCVPEEKCNDIPHKPKGSNIFTTPVLIAANLGRKHCQLPRSKYIAFNDAHCGVISRAKWNIPKYSHLLLTASFDKCIKIWDFVDYNTCVSTIKLHTNGVKDAEWSKCGEQILSGGFDKSVKLHDIRTGTCLHCFPTSSSITCVKFHPSEPNLILAGTYGSAIYCYDTKSGQVVNEYSGNFGEVLDVEFLSDGSEFVSASSIVGRDSANRTLMVWDFKAAAVVSNQLYHEKYTCPCVKVHPNENVFLAQSNANYIAIFSSNRPYKLNKFKRYESHKIEGYPIGFDFSPGGNIIASGSSDGCAYFYNYKTSKLLKKLLCYDDNDICTDVAYHPVLPGVVATCSWKGRLTIWQ